MSKNLVTFEHIYCYLNEEEKTTLEYNAPGADPFLFCHLLNRILESKQVTKQEADELYKKSFYVNNK